MAKTGPGSNLDDRLFASSDVARIAEVSLRQLQWWDERKLVSPRQKDRRRRYLPNEVIEIMVVAELRRKGVSLQKTRRVLRFLQRELGRRLRRGVRSNSQLHLLTDGKSASLEKRPERVIDLLRKARHPMFLVCVSDQLKRLASEKGSHRPDNQLTLF